MMRRFWFFACLMTLAGCTTMGKMADVMMDPDIQVGSNDEQPSTLGFSLLAERDVNPNESGEAAPIEFQVVLLAEDSKLLATDYDQVTADVEKALGKNYLDHQEYTLLPGQYKYLPPIKLDEETRYIGVIARYADPDHAQWRKVIKVKSMGQAYQILVHLRQAKWNYKKKNSDVESKSGYLARGDVYQAPALPATTEVCRLCAACQVCCAWRLFLRVTVTEYQRGLPWAGAHSLARRIRCVTGWHTLSYSERGCAASSAGAC